MTINAEELFLYLLAGLTSFAEKDFQYPYPETLVRARGMLAGAALQNGYPVTDSMTQFLHMIQRPIGTWWPLNEFPPNLDPELPLLYINHQIPDFAIDWLLDSDRNGRLFNVSDVAALSANRYIAEICNRLPGNPSLQVDYVDFRRFLINHPWMDAGIGINIPTNVRQLMVEVSRYYERVTSPNMIHQGRCWQCPRCKGILHWVDGQPHCAGGLCDRLIDMERAEPVDGNDILSLLMVFRRRVQLPGLPELNLYNSFSNMAGVSVELWPDGDRYDLRVETRDAKWQLDVKDYADPRELATHLHTRISHQAGARITYIIPAYRDDLTPGYLRQLRQLTSGISIMTDEELIAIVEKCAEVSR